MRSTRCLMPPTRPSLLIAHTVKGQGHQLRRGQLSLAQQHAVSDEVYEKALAELGGAGVSASVARPGFRAGMGAKAAADQSRLAFGLAVTELGAPG